MNYLSGYMIRDSSKVFEVKDMEQSDENNEKVKATAPGSGQRTVACNSSLGTQGLF